jgi:hypothetical protein
VNVLGDQRLDRPRMRAQQLGDLANGQARTVKDPRRKRRGF